MSLTFAGVALKLPTAEETLRIQREFPLRSFFQLAHSEWAGQNGTFAPHASVLDGHRVELNRLVWPRGASHWSWGLFLCNGADLDEIYAALATDGSSTLVLGSLSTAMYLLPPRPLSLTNRYVLPLVDERYFWWWGSTEAEIGADPYDDWEDLLTDLVSQVSSATVVVDSVPADYLEPAIGLPDDFEPVPTMIDRVAQSAGLRMVRHLDGTVEFQAYPTARTILTANVAAFPAVMHGGLYPLAVGSPPYFLNTLVPADIVLVFDDVAGGDPLSVTVSLSSLGLSEYSGATGFDLRKVFHTRIVHDEDEEDGWTEDDLQGYAEQWAQDWYLWALADVDVALPGINNWAIEALSFAVEWTYCADLVTTHVYRHGDRFFDAERPPNTPLNKLDKRLDELEALVEALQQAIEACCAEEGGTIFVPCCPDTLLPDTLTLTFEQDSVPAGSVTLTWNNAGFTYPAGSGVWPSGTNGGFGTTTGEFVDAWTGSGTFTESCGDCSMDNPGVLDVELVCAFGPGGNEWKCRIYYRDNALGPVWGELFGDFDLVVNSCDPLEIELQDVEDGSGWCCPGAEVITAIITE